MLVTWAVTLVTSLSYLAFPIVWRAAFTFRIVEVAASDGDVGPDGIWSRGEGFPWEEHLVGAILMLAAVVIPAAIHRRDVARLRRRAERDIDPSRAAGYRGAPGEALFLAHPEPALRAAAARYFGRLALSLALLLPLPLLSGPLMARWSHFTSCVPVWRGLVRPADYVLLILMAAAAMAAQFPTRRRVFGPIDDLLP